MKTSADSRKSARQALSLLQKQCSKYEKCTFDIRQKLSEWGVPASEAEEIIQKLKLHGFVDDIRYAHAFVHDKSRLAHWGAIKIQRALQTKKIAAAIITDAMQEIDEQTYKSELVKLLSRKSAVLSAALPAERQAKLLRFALSKGYEYADAIAAIKTLIHNH